MNTYDDLTDDDLEPANPPLLKELGKKTFKSLILLSSTKTPRGFQHLIKITGNNGGVGYLKVYSRLTKDEKAAVVDSAWASYFEKEGDDVFVVLSQIAKAFVQVIITSNLQEQTPEGLHYGIYRKSGFESRNFQFASAYLRVREEWPFPKLLLVLPENNAISHRLVEILPGLINSNNYLIMRDVTPKMHPNLDVRQINSPTFFAVAVSEQYTKVEEK